MPRLDAVGSSCVCKRCGVDTPVENMRVEKGGRKVKHLYVNYCKPCAKANALDWLARETGERHCKNCGTVGVGLYCSKDCEIAFRISSKEKGFSPTPCACCGQPYIKLATCHKYCSTACKGAHKYKTGEVTTESQYEKINGSWYLYFSRLTCQKGRKGQITPHDCIEILERQKYRCALSGVPLTKLMVKGKKTPSNASLDRIDAGGSYAPSNIQIVCTAVNQWRNAQKMEHFIWWCCRVSEHRKEDAVCPE